MSDTGPPPKRIKRGREDKDDFPTVVVPGTPGLRLDFNDDADGRVIMVTSSSSSGHQSFKFNTSTATSMTVNCGKLRLQITNNDDAIQTMTTLQTPQDIEGPSTPAIASASTTSVRLPSPPASVTQPFRPPSSVVRLPAEAAKSHASSSRSTSKREAPDRKPKSVTSVEGSRSSQASATEVKVDVIVFDYQKQATEIMAARSTQIGELIQEYARKNGLNAKNITTRLGSILERHWSFIVFEAKSRDDPEYSPFSDYESDDNDRAAR